MIHLPTSVKAVRNQGMRGSGPIVYIHSLVWYHLRLAVV